MGGQCGKGGPLKYTRAIIDAIHSTPVPSCTAIALFHRSGSVVLLRYKRSAPFHRRVTASDRRVCTSVPLPDAYVTHGRSNVRFACTLVGELVQADFEEEAAEPVFHRQFPRACSNVPSELLNPVCRNGFVRDYAPLSVHGTLIRRSHAVRTVGQAANWKDQELFKQTQEKLGQVPPPHGACSAARCMLRSAMQRRTVHVACCTVHVARCTVHVVRTVHVARCGQMFNANFEKKHAAMVDESIKRQGKRAQHATDTCRTACNARGLPHLQVRPCKASGRAISDRPGDSLGSLATRSCRAAGPVFRDHWHGPPCTIRGGGRPAGQRLGPSCMNTV